jgi:hypothetical protein
MLPLPSTVSGWLRRAPRVVTASGDAEAEVADLRHRVARLEAHCRRLLALLHVVVALLRVLRADLTRLRLAAEDKTRILRAVERTRRVPSKSFRLHAVLPSQVDVAHRNVVTRSSAMALARHSDISLTMKHYTDLSVLDLRGAVEKIGGGGKARRARSA